MSAIKVTQNIGDLTGSQVSWPIALISGYLRITPHLWNNEEDFFKLINCLKSLIY